MKKTGLRVGKVSSIDYETGMIQVVYADKGNSVTTKMPYANFNNEYCMPKVGESVLVGHLTNGSSRGVVLCTMWNQKNRPAEHGKGVYRKEFSKKIGSAFARFDEEGGEYLIKAPAVLLHGVDHTDVEGPEVNIAANIRTSFESPEHTAVLGGIHISGMEGGAVNAEISSDMEVVMDMAALRLLIREVTIETMEKAFIAADDMEMQAAGNMDILAGDTARVSSGGSVVLEDAGFKATLSSIMERLEALDGNESARK